MQVEVDQLKVDVAAANTDQLTVNVAQLDDDLKNHTVTAQGERNSLKDRVTGHDTRIADVEVRVTNLTETQKKAMANLTTQIESKIAVNKAEIDALNGNLTGLNTTVSGQIDRHANLSAAVTTQNAQVANITKGLSTARSDLSALEVKATDLAKSIAA